MISPITLAEAFDRNVEIIRMQTPGMSHEDSLVQLPFRSNCMNWVVGHILTNRYNILKLLGADQPVEAERAARYQRDSEPIKTIGSDVLQLEELIALLDTAQAQIANLLAEITQASLERQLAFYGKRSMSVAEWLMFFYFQDTYHTGQTEILRQALRMDDKIN